MKLDGRTIVLTGAGSGIGRELAVLLASKGARLVLTGRREGPLGETADLVKQAGSVARTVVGDVRDAGHRRAAIEAARDGFGALHGLVNNAGNVAAGRLETMDEADVRALIEVNLVAPILFAGEALPAIREAGGGMVVNVSSGMGLIGMPFYSVYGAAKGGLARFSEALRRELAGEGIHVMCAFPAATETPMMATSDAGPGLGVVREPAGEVAAAIVEAMERDAIDVIRGGEARQALLALNHAEPAQVDARFSAIKPDFESAVRRHRHL